MNCLFSRLLKSKCKHFVRIAQPSVYHAGLLGINIMPDMGAGGMLHSF